MSFQLQQGQRYTADIELGGLQTLASNEMVASKLRDAGFSNVIVIGSGAQRSATGTWSGASRSVELPKQVKSVRIA